MGTIKLTRVYAIRVPIDIISTKTSNDMISAMNAVKAPKMSVDLTGVLVIGETWASSENNRPSLAIAYTTRGIGNYGNLISLKFQAMELTMEPNMETTRPARAPITATSLQ